MSIQTTIATAIETLPPSLARIARIVGENPSIVVDRTINELAAECDTSVASVVRFCRAIGASGYAALRVSLAAELGRESAQLAEPRGFGSEISAADSLREAALLYEHVQMLLRAGGDPEQIQQLQQMADRLAELLKDVLETSDAVDSAVRTMSRSDLHDLHMMLNINSSQGSSLLKLLLDMLRKSFGRLWRKG